MVPPGCSALHAASLHCATFVRLDEAIFDDFLKRRWAERVDELRHAILDGIGGAGGGRILWRTQPRFKSRGVEDRCVWLRNWTASHVPILNRQARLLFADRDIVAWDKCGPCEGDTGMCGVHGDHTVYYTLGQLIIERLGLRLSSTPRPMWRGQNM